MNERRAHTRKIMHEPAFLLGSDGAVRTPVILLDISLRGASFATSEVLMSGIVRQLEFTLPGSRTRHNTRIEIVHQSTTGVPVGFRIGAMFVEIDATTTNEIFDFVSKSVQAE